MPGPGSVACPKPRRQDREKAKRRDKRLELDRVAAVRAYCFARERETCRICRLRPAASLHELTPRSLGGKVSRQNSIAVCGQIVGTERCCHTYIQLGQIQHRETERGAEGLLWFTPLTVQAAEWMHLTLGQALESAPMQEIEDAE